MSYKLIDSGNGFRLEQFGDKLLARPARSAIWSQRQTKQVWKAASAIFDHKSGWSFRNQAFEQWEVESGFGRLRLRLQKNGQIGLFPEHTLYLDQVDRSIKEISDRSPRVLNLFAYTGVATLLCASRGCQVTHVDISKSALEWAETNFFINQIPVERVRLLQEDALSFVAREKRRGAKYDLIIVDPPSFSRTSKNQAWDLEDVLGGLLSDCCSLLEQAKSFLFFTAHHQGIGSFGVGNLLMDLLTSPETSIIQEELTIKEIDTERKLHSGFLVSVSTTIN